MTDIVIVFSASFAGFLVSRLFIKQLLAKQSLYMHMYTYAQQLRNNVINNKLTITQFNDKYILEDWVDVRHVLSGGSVRYASSAENNYLAMFVSGLTANNSAALIEHLNEYVAYFDKLHVECADSNKRTNSAYSKVGLLLGAVVGLLVI